MVAERRTEPTRVIPSLDEILDEHLLRDPLPTEIEEGAAGLEVAVEAVEALADPADDEFRHGLEELIAPTHPID